MTLNCESNEINFFSLIDDPVNFNENLKFKEVV